MKKELTLQEEEKNNDFRVTIFGSARIKESDELYSNVFEIAKFLAEKDIDVVTGGGPGLMQAANEGHNAGNTTKKSQSIGLTIDLPIETRNKHLDIEKHFHVFSKRLDQFMRLSNVVIVMPGGVGTCLEFFYAWQLMQVEHTCDIPIILYGDMWEQLLAWIKEYPLKAGLISPKDLNMIFVAHDKEATIEIIEKTHQEFLDGGDGYCVNSKKYNH